MKKHLLHLSIFALLSLSACEYTPDPLPKYVTTDYELAFPIADTLIPLSKFLSLNSLPIEQLDIPQNTTVSHALDFPFYLDDLSKKDRIVRWIEPKAILNNSISQKFDISVSCHILGNDGATYTLTRDQLLAAGRNELFSGKRINAGDLSLANASRLYFQIDARAKENIPAHEIQASKLQLNFGIKVALHITLPLE